VSRFPLRLGRSRSIWEDGSIEELVRKEFTLRDGSTVDLKPSVYLVEREEAVRATAEHVLQRLRPEIAPGTVELDLRDLAPVHPAPASGHFRFTNERHAELRPANDDELRALVAAVRAAPERRIARRRDEIMAWAADRLAALDEEWQALLEQRPEWRRALEKWTRGRAVP
jgi:hypothetical protein